METIRALCRKRLTVDELAEQLGYCRRTAYRYLSAFEQLGVPLHSRKRGREVLYWIQKGEIRDWIVGG